VPRASAIELSQRLALVFYGVVPETHISRARIGTLCKEPFQPFSISTDSKLAQRITHLVKIAAVMQAFRMKVTLHFALAGMHPAVLLIALLIFAYAAAEQPAVASKNRKRTRNSEAGRRSVLVDAVTKKRRAEVDASSLAFSSEAETESFEFESDEGAIRRPRLQQADSKLNLVKTKLAGVRNEIGERAVGAAHKASKLLRELRGQLWITLFDSVGHFQVV
jgi:hypothetical protein